MRLTNVNKAQIPEAKVAKYLLSSTHRAGKSKAAFFTSIGFIAEKWEELAEALRDHAVEHTVSDFEETVFGVRYVVDGLLMAPNARRLKVRSVWFVDRGTDRLRFITAYPLKGDHNDSRT